MTFHWFLLFFSLTSLVASIILINHHQELNDILDDFTDRRQVSYTDYVSSGVLGYLGLPASVFCIGACVYLLIIDYFC